MGLAQNEMRVKPALPERVRSMEGLGVILCGDNSDKETGVSLTSNLHRKEAL